MPAGLPLSAIVLLNCLNSTTEHDILSTWVDTISVEVSNLVFYAQSNSTVVSGRPLVYK